MESSKKVAIVTGAGSGVGRATAHRLGRTGIAVLATDLHLQTAEETAAAIRDAGGRSVALAGDVGRDKDVEACVKGAVEEFGGLDIVANVAGRAIRKSLAETTMDDWYQSIDTNLTGIFLMCRHAAPLLREAGGGAIVNVSSVSGFTGLGFAAYCAAKGGVIGLTKQLATELAPDGIRVNTVAPGPVDTPFNAAPLAKVPSARATLEAATLVKRFGQPDEIAAVIEFLCGEGSSFITGEMIVADGGITSTVSLGAASTDYVGSEEEDS